MNRFKGRCRMGRAPLWTRRQPHLSSGAAKMTDCQAGTTRWPKTLTPQNQPQKRRGAPLGKNLLKLPNFQCAMPERVRTPPPKVFPPAVREGVVLTSLMEHRAVCVGHLHMYCHLLRASGCCNLGILLPFGPHPPR